MWSCSSHGSSRNHSLHDKRAPVFPAAAVASSAEVVGAVAYSAMKNDYQP